MKLISHRPKSRWHSPTFTLRGIDRETLSMILSFAQDAIEARDAVAPFGQTLARLVAMQKFVNGDEEERGIPLELPNYGDVPDVRQAID